MKERTGVSRSVAGISLAVLIVIAGASLYLASSMTGSRTQTPGASTTSLSTAITTAPTPPTASTTAITSGPDHMLIADFLPQVPIISQYLLLNYTLYFSTVGTVPSLLTISLSSPSQISLAVSPSQIAEPGLAPYVNATVSMRPSPSLGPGTYPVNVLARAGAVSYNETLLVQVVDHLIVMLNTPLRFQPSTYTVPVNTTVTWLRLNPGGNNGIIAGDVGIMDFNIPSLNASSRGLLQFQTASYTFTKPGTYAFVCDYYPTYMHGVITVTP